MSDQDLNHDGIADCLYGQELRSRANQALSLIGKVKSVTSARQLKAQKRFRSSLRTLLNDISGLVSNHAGQITVNGGVDLGTLANKAIKAAKRVAAAHANTLSKDKTAARKSLQALISSLVL